MEALHLPDHFRLHRLDGIALLQNRRNDLQRTVYAVQTYRGDLYGLAGFDQSQIQAARRGVCQGKNSEIEGFVVRMQPRGNLVSQGDHLDVTHTAYHETALAILRRLNRPEFR